VPADAGALPGLQADHALADRVDDPGHLVTGNPR
jgi:hypothetical protein